MPLIYAVVARGTTILADYAPLVAVARDTTPILAEYKYYDGDFRKVVAECLEKIQTSEEKFIVLAKEHTFNFQVLEGFTFVVVADDEYGKLVSFAYLDRVKSIFEAEYMDKAKEAGDHALDEAFSPVLEDMMEYCDLNMKEMKKVSELLKKVDQVKSVMVTTLEQVIENTADLETLQQQADVLQANAEMFQVQSASLRRKMWWQQNTMWVILMALLTIVFVIIIPLSICFVVGPVVWFGELIGIPGFAGLCN